RSCGRALAFLRDPRRPREHRTGRYERDRKKVTGRAGGQEGRKGKMTGREAGLGGILALTIALTAPAAMRTDGDTAAAMMARIEGAQPVNRQGYDGFTLEQLMSRFGVPGVGVAVISDFKIHWAKAYGVADVTSGSKVDTDTIFQAASISKPVNAMGSLRAVQDGRFTLDQDVNTILKSWKLPGDGFTTEQPVTLRGLTSHTSGTGDGFGFPGYHPSAPRPTIVQILDGEKPSNVGKVRLERRPLTGQKYSGGAV